MQKILKKSIKSENQYFKNKNRFDWVHITPMKTI